MAAGDTNFTNVVASGTIDAGTAVKVDGTQVLSSQGASVTATVANPTTGSAAVIHDSTTVDASAGGTAQTTNCTLVPANSLLLGVYVEVVTPFDGDTTQTMEVGVSGNIDAYIDNVDFDPSGAAGTNYASNGGTTNDIKDPQWIDGATQIIATWTNVNSAAAGSVLVEVLYIPFKTNDLETQVDALITDVAALRAELVAHGLVQA